MFRQILRIRVPLKGSAMGNLTTRLSLSSLPSSSTNTMPATKERWDLYAGILVERLPVVSKELEPQEQQFQEYLWRVEFENSLKSDHELRHERDIKQAELIKKGKAEVELDDASSKQTAQDLEDLYTEELKSFQPAPRKTADDVANNVHSTNRCLDDVLYLLVEQKLGQKSHLLLPQGKRQDGETMRQAAERVLREQCGEGLQVSFLSYAPCGFYKYKYPSDMRSQSVGAKVFFYRASLTAGNVDKKIVKNFEWLTQSILTDKLGSPEYAKSVKKFLL